MTICEYIFKIGPKAGTRCTSKPKEGNLCCKHRPEAIELKKESAITDKRQHPERHKISRKIREYKRYIKSAQEEGRKEDERRLSEKLKGFEQQLKEYKEKHKTTKFSEEDV